MGKLKEIILDMGYRRKEAEDIENKANLVFERASGGISGKTEESISTHKDRQDGSQEQDHDACDGDKLRVR